MWFVFGTLFVYRYVFCETLVFVMYFDDEDWDYLFITPEFALWIVCNFFCSKNHDEAEGGLLEWHCLWSETYMWLSALLNCLSLVFKISILSHIIFQLLPFRELFQRVKTGTLSKIFYLSFYEKKIVISKTFPFYFFL